MGRWNHRIEIEVRGLPKKYEGLYDGNFLDEEIEKLAAWDGNCDTPAHAEWIPVNAFRSTGETFGLIDPMISKSAAVDTDEEIELECEADAVIDNLLELDTGVTEETSMLDRLPASSRWLALSFGRSRPSGRVKSKEEWDYFKENIALFQRGAGNASDADNYSSIDWSSFTDHWNKYVSTLGASHPNLTFKTASLLQDAHKTLQTKARRATTMLQHTDGIRVLRQNHTSSSSNQIFANQFVAAEIPTRARPMPATTRETAAQTASILGNESDNDLQLFETPAEMNRRNSSGSKKRKYRKQRCRRCGKEWNTPQWKASHERTTTNKKRPHGAGDQVWDWCSVPESQYEFGFPQLEGIKRRVRKVVGERVVNLSR
jgi:hypothetical protein